MATGHAFAAYKQRLRRFLYGHSDVHSRFEMAEGEPKGTVKANQDTYKGDYNYLKHKNNLMQLEKLFSVGVPSVEDGADS